MYFHSNFKQLTRLDNHSRMAYIVYNVRLLTQIQDFPRMFQHTGRVQNAVLNSTFKLE